MPAGMATWGESHGEVHGEVKAESRERSSRHWCVLFRSTFIRRRRAVEAMHHRKCRPEGFGNVRIVELHVHHVEWILSLRVTGAEKRSKCDK